MFTHLSVVVMQYLEGQGDVVSRLIREITGFVM